MAQKPAAKAGRGPCPNCSTPLTFKLSAGGLMKFDCDECESSGYAHPDGATYAKWQASMTARAPQHTPAPLPTPEPTPAPTAAPRRASSVFDLGAL